MFDGYHLFALSCPLLSNIVPSIIFFSLNTSQIKLQTENIYEQSIYIRKISTDILNNSGMIYQLHNVFYVLI